MAVNTLNVGLDKQVRSYHVYCILQHSIEERLGSTESALRSVTVLTNSNSNNSNNMSFSFCLISETTLFSPLVFIEDRPMNRGNNGGE